MFRVKNAKKASLLLALIAGLFISGCQHDRDPHKQADKIVTRMKKELNLSDEQTSRVRKLAHEVADSLRPPPPMGMHEEMQGGFLKQLRADAVDTASLNKESGERMAEMQEHMKEHRAFMIREFTQLHDILTPEQREKLAAYLEKRKGEMREKYGHHEW